MPATTPSSSREITTDELAFALLRVTLPEHKSLHRLLPDLDQVSDQERKQVARCLAEIGRKRPASIEALIEELKRALGHVDRPVLNCILFMERSAQQWARLSPLDEFVKRAFVQRRHVFAALLLDQPEFVLSLAHPVAQLLSRVEELFLGWEEQHGQAPPFVMKALAATTRLLDADHVLKPEEQAAALAALTEEWQRERKRREKLEERLIVGELGQDRIRSHRATAVNVLNNATENIALPEEVIRFLHGPWIDSLRLSLTEHGAASENFRDMRALTGQMASAFSSKESPDDYRKIYELAVSLVDRVSRHMVSLVHEQDRLQAEMGTLQTLLMSVVRQADSELQRVPVPRLEGGGAKSVRRAMLERATALQGRWYRRQGLLCRLLTVLPASGEILWSDFAGRRVGLEPLQTALEQLDAGTYEPFEDTTRIHGVFAASARAFVNLDRLERIRFRERVLEERAARAAAERKAAEEAAAIRKAEEAAAEARRREEAAARAQMAQAQIEAEEREKLEQLHAARQTIDALQLGDAVELDKEDRVIVANLAVRLAGSQKLIFTDDIGLRVAELKRDEAVERLLAGTLRTVDDSAAEALRARRMGRMGVGRR